MEMWETKIRGRYFRKTKAHPEGSVVHDGDCDFYAVKHCSCGLLHSLRPYPEEAEGIYADFWTELWAHDNARETAFGNARKP